MAVLQRFYCNGESFHSGYIENASCILDEPTGGDILDINVINSVGLDQSCTDLLAVN